MISTKIPGYPAIIRCHLEPGEVLTATGDVIPIYLVGIVAEFSLPAPLRDDFGFITQTQMALTGYSRN